MEWHQSNEIQISNDDSTPLDVEPLKTLAPMFPSATGVTAFSISDDDPFVYVSTTKASLPSGYVSPPKPAFSSFTTPSKSPKVLYTDSDEEDDVVLLSDHTSSSGKKIKTVAELVSESRSDTEDKVVLLSNHTSSSDKKIKTVAEPVSESRSDTEDNVVLLSNHTSSSGKKIKTVAEPVSESRSDTEDKVVLLSNHTSSSGKRIKTVAEPVSESRSDTNVKFISQSKRVRKKLKVENHNNMALIPFLNDPKEAVDGVLMTYDAVRRKLIQLEDGKDVKKSAPNLKAGNVLMSNNIKANMAKRIGSVTGVEIGDIFYFRVELCLVGVHAPIMGGIDFMTSSFDDGDDTVAISVVSSGGYENEDSGVNSLIYTGQGDQNSNQKLQKGNLAMERSLCRGILVRVIRTVQDRSVSSGKIYYYDGLYKIEKSWVEKGRMGFNVFKFKLVRQPNQPHGLAIWKMTQQWKDNPKTRGKVISSDLSLGVESLPICLVNEIDDEKGPKQFKYSNKVEYLFSLDSMKPLEICQCLSVCLPGDVDCLCAKKNDGHLPYSSSGTIVSRKPVIYECNASCCCSTSCRNRATQKGIKLQFEVFKTQDRGWGLRSWDPIRMGTFICEYTGEVVKNVNLENEAGEDNEYIFKPGGMDEKAFKWNYGPELIGEPNTDYSSETLGSLPILVSAKNMGNISRFMNHSCSPNVFWQPVLYDHGDERYPHIMFFAMKHIPPMTELTYDYGTSSGAGSRMMKTCLCASSKCRGFFG